MCLIEETMNCNKTYADSISLAPSSSGTSRMYRTLLQLDVTASHNQIPNQNVSQKSTALSINVLLATGQLRN